MKIKLTIIWLMAFVSPLMAQRVDIVKDLVGKPCPDITFANLVNTGEKQVKISDYKGKIVILDFWATWCSPCVAALPKLDALQERFKDKVQVILISGEYKSQVENFFQKFKKNRSFGLFSATQDSLANSIFPHPTIPFTVIIDKRGMIHSIPFSEEITEANIALLLEDKKIPLKQDSVLYLRKKADMKQPLLKENIYKTKNIYYSMFSSYNPLYSSVLSIKSNIDSLNGGKITALNTPIQTLYAVAFGSFKEANSPYAYFIPYTRIIIRTKDSLSMKPPKDRSKMQSWLEKNVKSYEYIFPTKDTSMAHEYMKRDLQRMYGYNVKLEKRKVECLLLKKANEKSDGLATRGGTPYFDSNTYYLKMTNAPLGQLVHWLGNRYLSLRMMPVIDETGITTNIDLNLDVKLSDLDKLNVELMKRGLMITSGIREVDYLIIDDKQK